MTSPARPWDDEQLHEENRRRARLYDALWQMAYMENRAVCLSLSGKDGDLASVYCGALLIGEGSIGAVERRIAAWADKNEPGLMEAGRSVADESDPTTTDEFLNGLGGEAGGTVEGNTWRCVCGDTGTGADESSAALALYFHRLSGHQQVEVRLNDAETERNEQ